MIDDTGKNITLVGANISFDTTQKKFGAGALKISAAGSYATMPSIGFKSLGTRNFTIDFWIYRTAVNDVTYADAIFASSVDGKAVSIGINPDGKMGYCVSATAGTWGIRLGVDPATPRGSNVIPLNTWTHVALVRNGSTFTGYVNGMFDQSWTSSSAISDYDDTVYFGHWGGGTVRTFLGYIDEFRIRLDDAVWTNNFATNLPSAPYYDTQELDNLTYTKLLIKGNGSNGSTNIIDDYGKSVTVAGNASISTAQSKFGDGSIYFDGTGDYLSIADSSDFAFGTGDFTVEMWIYPTSLSTARGLYDHRPVSTNGLYPSLYINASSQVVYYVNSTDTIISSAISVNNWYHVAVTRSGTNTKLFVNGAQAGSTYTDSNNYLNGRFTIGTSAFSTGTNDFAGYMQDIRITKGLARYTTNFTPPNSINAVDYTVLLLKANGYNGSTNIKEETGKSVTVNGSTVISTNQSKFGGSSLYFSGGTDYINLTDCSDFAFGTGDFTIECWIYSTDSTSDRHIIDFRPNGSQGLYPMIYRSNGGAINFFVNGSGAISGSVITSNAWHHIAVCRSSGITKLFIDGTQSGSSYTDTNNYLVGTNRPIIGNVGVLAQSSTYVFLGNIDDVRMYKGWAKYTSNFTAPTLPQSMISSYPQYDTYKDNTVLLINGNGSNNGLNIFDQTGKAITINGNARISSTQSKFGGSSLYFDGTGDYLIIPTYSDFALATGDFTIECWINPASWSTYNAVWVVSTNLGVWFGNVTGTFGLRSYATANLIMSTLPSTGTWTHVAVTRASGTLRLFYNGSVVNTVTGDTTNFASANPSYIGYDGSTPTTYFNGYIQDLRVTKGIALYTANFTPPTSSLSLIAYNPASQYTDSYSSSDVLIIKGEGAIGYNNLNFTDQSSNAYTITTNGTPGQGPFGPYTGFSSGHFNSTTDYLSAPSITLSGDFTIEGWFYDRGTPSGSAFWGVGSDAGGIVFRTYSGNAYFYYVGAGGVFNVAMPTQNVWNHIAVTRQGTTLRLFYNGVLKSTATVSGNPSGTIGVGKNLTGTAFGPYYGYISNFRIVNGTAVYTAAFTPSTTPVTAITNTAFLCNFDNAAITSSVGTPVIITGGNAKIAANNKVGQSAISFAANGDYLSLIDSTNYDFGSGDFTIEFWSKHNSFVDYGNLYGKRNTAGGYCGIEICTMSSKSIVLYSAIGSASWTFSGTVLASGLSTNTWYHFALVRSGNVWTAYLNGVPSWTITQSGTLYNTTDRLNIGGFSDGTYSINGYIDNLRVTKGVARYKANFIPPSNAVYLSYNQQSKVALHLNCDGTNNSTSIVDGTGKTVTVAGNTKISTTQSKFGGSSIYFDGTGDYLSIPSSSDFNFANNDFTIEFWVYPTSLSSSIAYVGQRINNTSVGSFVIFSPGTSSLTLYMSSNGSSWDIAGGTTMGTLSVNAWNHVALTRVGNTFTPYINGVAGTTVTSTASLYYNSSTPLTVGGDTNNSYLNGYIDDLRITLGQSTISQYSSFTLPTSEYSLATTGKYQTKLLLHANDATDSSISNRTITLTGATVDTTTKKFGTGSFSTSARGNIVSIPYSPDWYFANTDCTIEFWFRPTSLTGGGSLIGQNAVSADNAWFAYVYATGSIGIGISGISEIVSATGVIAINNWYHVAIVKYGTTTTIYVNGTSVASGTNVSFTNSGNNLVIGTPTGQTYWTGLTMNIDEIRISTSAMYTSNFTAPVNPFTF